MPHSGKFIVALTLAAGTAFGASAQAPRDEREAVLLWSSHDGALQEGPDFASSPPTEVSPPALDQRISDVRNGRLLICEPDPHSDPTGGRAAVALRRPETDAAGRPGR